MVKSISVFGTIGSEPVSMFTISDAIECAHLDLHRRS